MGNKHSFRDMGTTPLNYNEILKYLDDPVKTLEILEFLNSIYGKKAKHKCYHKKKVITCCSKCMLYGYSFIIPINAKFHCLSHELYQSEFCKYYCIKPRLYAFCDATKIHLRCRYLIITKLENFVDIYKKSGFNDIPELIYSAERYLDECRIIHAIIERINSGINEDSRIERIRDVINIANRNPADRNPADRNLINIYAPSAPEFEPKVEGAI